MHLLNDCLLSYPLQTDQLIILAVKFNQNGYIDWVNIANELGNGLTNVQCKSRYRKLIEQGRIMSHKAEYMSTSYTPDPSYSYDVDVVKAFNTQPKKKNLPKKNGLWSTLMVRCVYQWYISML